VKIHKITEKHIGKILKCHVSWERRFSQYEYILSTDSYGYKYRLWNLQSVQPQSWEYGMYSHNGSYYWEPVSDLELVVLGIPFPEGYVRESDRTK
jgi:WD40 repeat protein